jgi:XTP/dITP diphosphohydrolase
MVFKLKGRFIFFATNNVNKFDEARRVLADYNIAVGMLRVKTSEIQSDSLKEIAETSAKDAFQKCRLPIIVEDAGLFVDGLNGFPGPYAAYVYMTIGNRGLLKLMKGNEKRKAKFESVIAYFSRELKSPICFSGQAAGEIVAKERVGSGRKGFGFDPVFKPDTSDKTFAEMDVTEKNRNSHRADALRKFAEWYKRAP